MQLVIDAGNTRIKVAMMDAVTNTIIKGVFSFEHLLASEGITEILKDVKELDAVIISSVIHLPDNLIDLLQIIRDAGKLVLSLDWETPLPIVNGYKSKATLGNDRVAAAVGAECLYPGHPLLVIDAGTAITLDYVTTDKVYMGGNISPGIQLRFKALHNFTAKLPLLSRQDDYLWLGSDTASAIVAGVQNGVVYELDGFISDFVVKHSGLKVILTGGDSFFFEKRLKNIIFVHPYLVFVGLSRILSYNIK